MKKVYFVTGIDTNVGKSIATGYLANQMMQEGKKVITQKLIQTGNVKVSEDIEMHRKLMGLPLLDVDKNRHTCPYIFTYPCSPHLAARIDRKEISIAKINECTNSLLSKYDVVLLEGAGGIMVPIQDDYLTIDFIKDEKLPIILVTSPKLGSLNHTLLTIESCLNRGIVIDTIVYNDFPKGDEVISPDTYAFIQKYMDKHKMDTKLIKIPNIEIPS
ncbi:Dethiobiotin synthetase [Bacteroides coprosuis DSM 18011]|uniref:ATP-dependent dethiobiotin synthetase BioD n=1 Tax=Bacteroides coprosuis DSM 18011 TaxID=679937 RepID=F3ZUN9_9BACE|nr:dethiobiotin synthase [Bacteroides coprosuis]EGJ71204.1 Dethiobiotin synthetase [Bacteroides coprosuis DSM 18011]